MLQTANSSSPRVSAAAFVGRAAGDLFMRFGKRYNFSSLVLTLAIQNLFYDRWRLDPAIVRTLRHCYCKNSQVIVSSKQVGRRDLNGSRGCTLVRRP